MGLRRAHFDKLRTDLDRIHANQSNIEKATVRSELSTLLESLISYPDILCDDDASPGEEGVLGLNFP